MPNEDKKKRLRPVWSKKWTDEMSFNEKLKTGWSSEIIQ